MLGKHNLYQYKDWRRSFLRYDVDETIEILLKYGVKNGIVDELDVIPIRNELMDLFQVEEPFLGEVEDIDLETLQGILDELVDYAFEKEIIKSNTIANRDLFDTRIMGLLTPMESVVVNKFWDIQEERGIKEATNYFYDLCQKINYIRTNRINKNLHWIVKTVYGEMEITINLSKPEKDPRDIERAKNEKKKKYPKCFLCVDNVGFSGSLNHPARQNLRVIPLRLNGEQWFFQYSPYVYYNEHSIVFKSEHVPMKINKDTFRRLFDFVDIFPHYFIGSNADLPVVGGSILSHEHFQSGRHVFPIEKAEVERKFYCSNYPNVSIGIVKWPMSVIRLSGENRDSIIELSNYILCKWKDYSDEEVNIVSKSEIDGEKVCHNTITPILRMNENKEYEMDLVLRNNRRNEEYPDGIFHPHKNLHNIKRENIGLIEVMGLAILPGRLKKELNMIEEILTGREYEYYDEKRELFKHRFWIDELKEKYGINLNHEKAREIIENEVGYKFQQVLLDAGVFKRDELGKAHFDKFMNLLGFEKQRED